jgi:dihydrofolate synthase/folylpolyglutamate synthase
MDYKEAYRFIFSLGRFGGGRDLEAIKKSLASTGNPQADFPSIHVAGTNGKGSTAAVLESLLCQNGLKTGLYTSPHLLKVNERIRIGGREIDNDKFCSTVEELSGVIKENGLSFFEALTLLAFKIFSDEKIDMGVIEVGLGGRLDATNVVNSMLSIVTNIDLDHTAYLGTTLDAIAREKLGILKKGVPLLTGVTSDDLKKTFRDVARECDVPVHFLDDEICCKVINSSTDGTEFSYRSPGMVIDSLIQSMSGSFQVRNAALAIRALELLDRPIKLDKEYLTRGLELVDLPGRFQIVRERPNTVIFDVFHNESGARAVRSCLLELFGRSPVYLILGMADDKDLIETARTLSPVLRRVFAVQPDFGYLDRDVGPADVRPAFRDAGVPVRKARSMRHAWSLADSEMKRGDILLVGGSFRTVAEAYKLLSDS